MYPKKIVPDATTKFTERKQTKWVRVRRELHPTITVGKTLSRGDFYGAEAMYSSFSGVLDSDELASLSSLPPGTEAGERFDASAWSTVVCCAAGDV